MASSSLVGQALGQDDEHEAGAWASDIMRFSLAAYALIAVGVLLFVDPIARVFVDEPAILPLVTTFLTVAAVSILFNGVYGASTGPLRASGDTRWPMYAQLTGLYLFTLPVAYLGAVTSIGITALYAAIVLEMAVPATITYYRYRSDTWKVVSRDYRPDAAATTDWDRPPLRPPRPQRRSAGLRCRGAARIK